MSTSDSKSYAWLRSGITLLAVAGIALLAAFVWLAYRYGAGVWAVFPAAVLLVLLADRVTNLGSVGLHTIVPWAVAISAASGIPILVHFAAPDRSGFIWLYAAGGIGGFAYELLSQRWLIELPSYEPAVRVPADASRELASDPSSKRLAYRATVEPPDGKDTRAASDEPAGNAPTRGDAQPDVGTQTRDDSSADVDPIDRPLGPRLDLGFFGRAITAGLGACIVITIYAAATSETGVLDDPPTDAVALAWAAALGAFTPLVWRTMRKIVQARLESLAPTLEAAKNNTEKAKQAVADASAVNGQPLTPPPGEQLDLTELRTLVPNASDTDPMMLEPLSSAWAREREIGRALGMLEATEESLEAARRRVSSRT